MKRLFLFLLMLFVLADAYAQGITLLYTGGGTHQWNDPASWIQIKVPEGQTPIQQVPTEKDDVVFSQAMSGLAGAGFRYEDSVEIGGTNPLVNRCRSMRISNMEVNWGFVPDYAAFIHVYTTNGGQLRIDSGGNISYGRLILHGGDNSIYDLEIIDSKYGNLFTHGEWSSIQLMPKGRAKIVNSNCEGWNFGSYPGTGGELYAENSSFKTPSFVLGDSSKTTMLDCKITDGNNFVTLSFGIGPGSDFTSRNVELSCLTDLLFYTSGAVFNGTIITKTDIGGLRLQQKYPDHPLPNIIDGNIHAFANLLDLNGDLKLSGNFFNIGVQQNMYPDSSHVYVNGQHAFEIGGISNYGDATSINNCTKPSCHFKLEFFGNGNSNVEWPVGFPVDTLVINKTNCAKVTFKNPIYVSGETRIKAGQLALDPNENIPFKLVCIGDLNIAQGGGLFLRKNSNDLNAGIAVAGNITDQNTEVDSTCTGLSNPYNATVTLYKSSPTSGNHTVALASNASIGNMNLISEQGADTELEGDLNVNNFTFTNPGKLILGNHRLIVNGAISNFGPSNYFVTNGTGKLQLNKVGNSETIFPIGPSATSYNPVTLTNTGTPDDFRVAVKTGVLSGSNLYVTGVVNRTWNVEEAVAGGSNVAIKLQWNAADELPGFARTSSFLSHYTVGTWDKGQQMAATGTDPYTLTRTNITSFSPFAVLGESPTLPLRLIEFSGQYKNNAVELYWITEAEVNIRSFTIEKSVDQSTFTSLSTIPAGNLSQGRKNYPFSDKSPLQNINYYRLKTINLDGTFTYSKIITVIAPATQSVFLYPNPARDKLFVRLPVGSVTGLIQIVDANGHVFKTIRPANGLHVVTVNIVDLPAGIYTLTTSTGGKKNTLQFVKQ